MFKLFSFTKGCFLFSPPPMLTKFGSPTYIFSLIFQMLNIF
jgi:hypothetical protein